MSARSRRGAAGPVGGEEGVEAGRREVGGKGAVEEPWGAAKQE